MSQTALPLATKARHHCGPTCRQADVASREGRPAEGRVSGALRGGYVHEGSFWTWIPEPVGVPVEAVGELRYAEEYGRGGEGW